ncbi:MAG: helix-turn-helix domain-containing protein [Pseudomonadota bacterium]
MMEKQRRRPEQRRAKVTCDAILTAAAHVLEREGEGAFTTNRIAEKAGVSIGSLYQYYRHKDDILVALAEREERALLSDGALKAHAEARQESALRLGLRSYINLLPDCPAARSKALEAMLRRRGPEGVAEETERRFAAFEAFETLSSTERFVLSRAITGVVQSAVRESRADLQSRAFEDTLVLLVRGFLKGRSVSTPV